MVERNKMTEKENRIEGGKSLESSEGDSMFGPTSDAKIKVELDRLIKVYESIKKNNYFVDGTGRNNIGVVVMVDNDDDWRVHIASGHHRAAALGALGKNIFQFNLE